MIRGRRSDPQAPAKASGRVAKIITKVLETRRVWVSKAQGFVYCNVVLRLMGLNIAAMPSVAV